MLVELTQEGEHFIVPKGAVRHSANLAKEMIDARIGKLAKAGGQIAKSVTEGNGAHPIRGPGGGLRSLNGSSEQGIETGREEELEILNARQPIQGNAGVYTGFSEKIEDIEMDQAQPLAPFLMRGAAAPLLIDDLLQGLWQIGRRELEAAFRGDFLSEPRVQHVVSATKGDGAGTDDRNYFLHLHAIKELLPKVVVQFGDYLAHGVIEKVVRTISSTYLLGSPPSDDSSLILAPNFDSAELVVVALIALSVLNRRSCVE
jgi:hypothetical protein